MNRYFFNTDTRISASKRINCTFWRIKIQNSSRLGWHDEPVKWYFIYAKSIRRGFEITNFILPANQYILEGLVDLASPKLKSKHIDYVKQSTPLIIWSRCILLVRHLRILLIFAIYQTVSKLRKIKEQSYREFLLILEQDHIQLCTWVSEQDSPGVPDVQ